MLAPTSGPLLLDRKTLDRESSDADKVIREFGGCLEASLMQYNDGTTDQVVQQQKYTLQLQHVVQGASGCPADLLTQPLHVRLYITSNARDDLTKVGGWAEQREEAARNMELSGRGEWRV